MESTVTLKSLADKYIAWCVKHRSPRTVEWYSGHLDGFMEHLGDNANMPITALKPFHIVEWVDSHGSAWGNTYKGGAIVAVKRLYNWAEELGYIESNPIKKLKKPTAERREIYMAPDDYQNILGRLTDNDPFKAFLTFVWHSGCRPQEARHIELRHYDEVNQRIVFPAEESKGKRKKRIIYLHGVTLDIIRELVASHPEGKLFRNTRGDAWTKYAICNRFHRLSQVIGKRMFCYAARHGFGTRKLIDGHDSITVAALMGHTDGSMLAKVYSHVDQNVEHLRQALD